MQSVYMVNLSYPLCTYESVLHYPAGFLRSKSCVTCPSLFYISALPSSFTTLELQCLPFLPHPTLNQHFFKKPNFNLNFCVLLTCNAQNVIHTGDSAQYSSPKGFFFSTTLHREIFLQHCLLRFQSPIMIFAWVHCFYKSVFFRSG